MTRAVLSRVMPDMSESNWWVVGKLTRRHADPVCREAAWFSAKNASVARTFSSVFDLLMLLNRAKR